MRLILLFIWFINAFAYNRIHPNSFFGSWVLKESNKKQKIIHLSNYRSIYQSFENETRYVGSWDLEQNNFNFVFNDRNQVKVYTGKVYANSLNVCGEVSEGLSQSCYLYQFSMIPMFEQFHEISYIQPKPDLCTYFDEEACHGKWILENIDLNQLYVFELFKNNTWISANFSGKWNLFNETNEININSAIKHSGKNIWFSITYRKPYINYDVVFIGKITKLTNLYFYQEELPSSENSNFTKVISSQINGTVCYAFCNEEENSERFYMRRWFN